MENQQKKSGTLKALLWILWIFAIIIGGIIGESIERGNIYLSKKREIEKGIKYKEMKRKETGNYSLLAPRGDSRREINNLGEEIAGLMRDPVVYDPSISYEQMMATLESRYNGSSTAPSRDPFDPENLSEIDLRERNNIIILQLRKHEKDSPRNANIALGVILFLAGIIHFLLVKTIPVVPIREDNSPEHGNS